MVLLMHEDDFSDGDIFDGARWVSFEDAVKECPADQQLELAEELIQAAREGDERAKKALKVLIDKM